jgi:hypothetical protein
MTETDDEIRERNLKRIGEISKDSDVTAADFSNLTKEQEEALDEEAKRFGFVKIKQSTIEDEKSKPEPEV